MSKRYQVLARKYRPQAFRDVVGQEAAVTTLKNAIQYHRIAHAYLFCGSRGIGKTTLARLFAKALNCQSPTPELEPCNQCPSCQEITAGQSLDVIEIDGASNRGIDDIRQINETVGYAPSHGRYKIYIIDEVHMLTKEAFNALLKTLEEPPEHAKFFFATTEPHKVLPTIISRCQRFDLSRIQPSRIASKLQQIALDLERSVEPEALELIATFSEGSLRDAESLFDQILCFSDSTITASTVRQTLGLAPQELFHSLDQAFSAYHLPYAFELVDQLFQTGKDLPHFLEQLIEHYRNIVNAKCRQNESYPAAKLYTQQQALHILDLLIQAESQFQKSSFQRIALESLLLQIIRSKNRIPIEALIRHLTENAEKITQNGEVTEKTGETPKPAPVQKEEIKPLQPVQAIETPKPPSMEKTEAAPEKAELKQPEPAIETPKPASTQKVELKPLEPVEIIEATKPSPKEAPPELQTVPFNPFGSAPKKEEAPPAVKKEPVAAPAKAEAAEKSAPVSRPAEKSLKHPSHYDTIMRFAAVEFEGTIKN